MFAQPSPPRAWASSTGSARVADDPAAFAEAVVSLYTDETLWSHISANGQTLVEERFGDAANRADFLAALNDARALPLSLLVEHCQRQKPVPIPQFASAVRDVSIIVPVYNKWSLTRACLNSIVLTSAGSGVRYEVILADDGSTDETVHESNCLRASSSPRHQQTLGFCGIATTPPLARVAAIFSCSNNDTIVLPGWLKALYDAMESDPEIAIAGSKLLYPDGTVQEAGGVLYQDGSA